MRTEIVTCDFCRQQFVGLAIILFFNGDPVDLCSAECFAKWTMRLYHRAMAEPLTLEISTGEGVMLKVQK